MADLQYRPPSEERTANLRDVVRVILLFMRRALGLWRPLCFLLASTLLLTLAFAPVEQFFLAWIGLVPWLVFVHQSKSQSSAFFLSWVGGTLFFTANMWWMGIISVPGMLALMVYCGLYWGFTALVIRGAKLLTRGLTGVFAVAAVWTAFEYLRGTLITGLPWLFLGHTQSPILPMCQVADVTGAYGVSFWVSAVNAILAMAWIQRGNPRLLWAAAAAVALLVLAVFSYGIFRIQTTPDHLSPGPVVAVVQPDDPQSNTGAKGADAEERLYFHENETSQLVIHDPGKIDLVAWSETIMPPINEEARIANPDYEGYYAHVRALAQKNHVAVITGGEFGSKWTNVQRDGHSWSRPLDLRNTAYFFDKTGFMSDLPGKRYDKIHLVPWGEFIPFKHSIPFIYNIFIYLGPQYYADYELQPGAATALTVFDLQGRNHAWRFATPICFEDIDSRICAAMFRPENGGGKRADFLVNLTNDGWFRANQNAQHFQAAIFRTIENRAPMARSVNTGISGFIDSTGQPHDLLRVRTSGSIAAQMMIDNRLTLYTLWGDLFAGMCLIASAAVAIIGWIQRPRKVKVEADETQPGKMNRKSNNKAKDASR